MMKPAVALGALMLLAVACAEEAPPATPGEFGAMCTTVTDNGTECNSGVCSDAFEQLGYNVCTLTCTPGDGSTCPEGSDGKKCNMKGYCKP